RVFARVANRRHLLVNHALGVLLRTARLRVSGGRDKPECAETGQARNRWGPRLRGGKYPVKLPDNSHENQLFSAVCEKKCPVSRPHRLPIREPLPDGRRREPNCTRGSLHMRVPILSRVTSRLRSISRSTRSASPASCSSTAWRARSPAASSPAWDWSTSV